MAKRRPKTLTITITINAALSHSTRPNIWEDRGVDLTVKSNTNMRVLLGVLFDGFQDRLKAAGIKAAGICNFT